MFKIPLIYINPQIHEPFFTTSHIHNSTLYILTLSRPTILTAISLITGQEHTMRIDTPLLTAKIYTDDYNNLNILAVSKSKITLLKLDDNHELSVIKQYKHTMKRPVVVDIVDENIFIKEKNSIFKFSNGKEDKINISSFFSKINHVYIICERIVCSSSNFIFVYNFSGKLESKIKCDGILLKCEDKIVVANNSTVTVYDCKLGAKLHSRLLVSYSHKIFINYNENNGWNFGEYKNELLFLTNKSTSYVDGYIFKYDDLITNYLVYKNTLIAFSKDNLYFLANDPDFEIDFTESENSFLQNFCKKEEKTKNNFLERTFLIEESEGNVAVENFFSCLVYFGVQIKVKKLILNELNKKNFDHQKILIYKKILEFDLRVRKVYKEFFVDLDVVFGKISGVLNSKKINFDLIMKMNRVLFVDFGEIIEVEDIEWENLDEYFMMRHIVDENKGLINEAGINMSISCAIKLIKSGKINKNYANRLCDFLVTCEERKLEILNGLIEGYENYKGLKYKNNLIEYLIKEINLDRERVIMTIIKLFNEEQVVNNEGCKIGNVEMLFDLLNCETHYLEHLDSKYEKSLKKLARLSKELDEIDLRCLYNFYKKMKFEEEKLLVLMKLYNLNGDERVYEEIIELLGDKVLILDNKFIGKECFKKKKDDKLYALEIKRNLEKLRLMEPWIIWTEVGKAEKCGLAYVEYLNYLEKAEKIYFESISKK